MGDPCDGENTYQAKLDITRERTYPPGTPYLGYMGR